ncbi:MAG: hypothetical protein AVDCRST_MAG56-3032, partial [uncultured Cytophagales bacterium]
ENIPVDGGIVPPGRQPACPAEKIGTTLSGRTRNGHHPRREVRHAHRGANLGQPRSAPANRGEHQRGPRQRRPEGGSRPHQGAALHPGRRGEPVAVVEGAPVRLPENPRLDVARRPVARHSLHGVRAPQSGPANPHRQRRRGHCPQRGRTDGYFRGRQRGPDHARRPARRRADEYGGRRGVHQLQPGSLPERRRAPAPARQPVFLRQAQRRRHPRGPHLHRRRHFFAQSREL